MEVQMPDHAPMPEQHDQTSSADQRWEELFAQPEAKRLMQQMAREAREEYLAGRTTEIAELVLDWQSRRVSKTAKVR